MGKWLISTLTDEAWDEWRYIDPYNQQHDPFEDEHRGRFGDRILVYDDERDEFSNKIIYHRETNTTFDYASYFICPTFCNARTVRKENPEEYGTCVVEPIYPEQIILSDLWPDEEIPQNRIRYFVIHKRILDDGNDTETYKIVGNDRTKKYIELRELNILLEKGLIVNREDLNGKLPVFYEVHEKTNRDRIMLKAGILARNSRALGITYPDLDYVFLGNEVIIKGINRKWLDQQERPPVIKNLFFPEGVTKIADGAFMTGDRETHILSVTLKPTIREIGAFAFWGREELASIDFNGAKLKRIGEYAFGICKYLKLDVDIYPEVTEFENGVFFECGSVNVNFIETPKVHRIGMFAFHGTNVSMELPGSLKEIEAYAFSSAKLTDKNVVIPEGVKVLEDSAFHECDLSTVVLPKNLTVLSNYLFSESKLSKLPQLPDSLVKIGVGCFMGCSDMTGILEVPATLKEIGEFAFEHTAISKAILTSNIKSIPDHIFNECENLQEVILPDELTSIGYKSFCGCISLTEIRIPSSVCNIYNEAFLGCVKLDKVEYKPETLLNLGTNAFCKDFGKWFDNYDFPKDLKVKFSDDTPEKGDLVMFLCLDGFKHIVQNYGIFDHMTEGDYPKANVWILPKTYPICQKDEVWTLPDNYPICQKDEQQIQPVLYEIKGLRVRKVQYDENDFTQRIIRDYLQRKLSFT